MAENPGKRISKTVGDAAIEFAAFNDENVNSPVRVPEVQEVGKAKPDAEKTAPTVANLRNYSPEFLELAEPKLPALQKTNRARLLMQTPNRLYFYWTIGKNPFHTLSRALGQPGGYALVVKLIDLKTGRERIDAIDPSGSWWFDVDADGEYQAEIGFYAVNRPYIRILYSNTVATPRKSPSPRTADTAEWRVPAEKFAVVLGAAGFERDAFDVALAGDDTAAADTATRSAFAQFSGQSVADLAALEPSELRYTLLALASGVALSELRGLISETLFQILSTLTAPTAQKALAALKEKFEFDAEDLEFDLEEETGAAVYGLSLVHFPKKPRKSRKLPFDLNPLSSQTARPTSGQG